MSRPVRRNVLLVGLVLAVALAGCTGGGGTPTATVGGDGSDGSDGSDGASDGTGDGSDGSDGDGDATPVPTPSPTATATPTSNASGATTTEPLPRMSELLELEDSYRFTAEFQTEEGTVLQEGRWYETDFAVEITFQGEDRTLTVYNVGGREAYETGGECFSQNVPDTKDPGNWTEAQYLQNISVRPSETTTIDGQTVYVYETESGQPNLDGPFTYYVSAETGHLLKQESGKATVEMWDWGEADPIEAPC